MKKIIRITTTATQVGRKFRWETDAKVDLGKYAELFTDPEGFQRDFSNLLLTYDKGLTELIMKYARKEEKHDGNYAI